MSSMSTCPAYRLSNVVIMRCPFLSRPVASARPLLVQPSEDSASRSSWLGAHCPLRKTNKRHRGIPYGKYPIDRTYPIPRRPQPDPARMEKALVAQLVRLKLSDNR